MDWKIFLSIFVITLRNIFPLTLFLGIIFACFQRLEKPKYYRQIYFGISAGMIASILVGSFFSTQIKNLNISNNAWIFTPLIINLTIVMTIFLLIWFILFLSKQAHLWQKISGTNDILMGKYSRQLVLFLIFFLVFPKAIEIVLLLDYSPNFQGLSGILGAIASFLLIVMMTLAFFYLQTKLNSSQYFQTMGIVLIFLTGGLMINTIYNIEENIAFINELSNYKNWCLFEKQSCLLGLLIWQNNSFFSDKNFPFILLKILFGYHDHIYLIPLISYLLFIIIMIKVYCQNLKTFS